MLSLKNVCVSPVSNEGYIQSAQGGTVRKPDWQKVSTHMYTDMHRHIHTTTDTHMYVYANIDRRLTGRRTRSRTRSCCSSTPRRTGCTTPGRTRRTPWCATASCRTWWRRRSSTFPRGCSGRRSKGGRGPVVGLRSSLV